MKKSIFSKLFLLCLFAIIGVGNASAKVLYCKCAQNWWKADGAAVGAHYWGGTGTNWPGKRMTPVTGQSDVWAIEIPDDNANIIFLRVNGTGNVENWGAQTNDLTIGTTNNFYTITSTSAKWSGDGNKVSGNWSTFQLESQASITPSASSVSVGEEVTFTPALTSNQEYNDVLSTTYSVGTGATITSGKFVATEAGTYTVTATVTYNAKGYTNITKTATATCSITVSAVAVPHPVTGVTIAPTSVTIKQGATATLTATVSPSNADDPSITWSSDNTSVATVVNGVVTAVAAGTANITVTTVDGGFTATCAVKVKPSQYTFYAINSAQWPTVAAHYWGGADGGSSWPGADMVKESETINGFNIYSITISSDFTNIMFTNKIDGDNNKKTADLTTEGNNGKYYDIKGAKWYASLSEVPVSYDYYVVGSFNGWNTADAAYGMTKEGDVYKKEVTFAKDAQFKVCNGTWGAAWGAQNLGDNKYTELGGTDNIVMNEEKTFTIIFNPAQNLLTFEGLTPEAVVTYDYYVIGTINGWATKDENFGMTDENADGVYEKEVTLAAGNHEIKVNNGTWDNDNTFGYDQLSVKYEGVSRGSGEGDNNIVIELTENKTITVKFDKNAKKITLDGLTEKAPEPTFDYYIVGSFNGDDPKKAENGMTLDGTVYKATVTLAAGDNTLKVTDGTWENTWGYGQLGAAYEEVSDAGEYNNIKITLAAEKSITVIFDATGEGKITFEDLTEEAPVVEDYSNQPATIYFRPSTNWKDADARFAAYFFGTEAKWLDMTDSDSDGIYEVANDKTNANVIFCRMNPATTENNWDNKWTQTDDIVIPNEADNLNTVWVPWQNYNYNQQASGIWVAPTPLTDTNWSDFVTAYKGKTINAVVERSFVYEQLHTLCLPFNVELHWLGEEAKAYKLNSVVGNSAQELSLNASECATMTAGQPYIVKPKKGSEYEYLIVADAAVQNVSAGSYTITGGGYKVTMQGIAATPNPAQQTDGSTEYWLAMEDGCLYKTPTNKLGLRSIIKMTTTSGAPINVRARVAFNENVETGVEDIITTETPVKVIENGQLIIIRDGVKYNVQGQKL